MAEMKLLQPYPGHWILPVMRWAGCAESERRDVVVMVFMASAEQDDEVKELSIRIPFPMEDASVLLTRLLELQAAGRLPSAAEAADA